MLKRPPDRYALRKSAFPSAPNWVYLSWPEGILVSVLHLELIWVYWVLGRPLDPEHPPKAYIAERELGAVA
jgi:hypothetical protein